MLVTRGDKPSVFVAVGSQIRGFTVKGKEFFKLDTSHTDEIKFIQVLGNDLWSAGANTLNCYTSAGGKIVDKYYYISDERITFMDVAEVIPGQTPLAVIAAGDSIRVIDPQGHVMYFTTLDS